MSVLKADIDALHRAIDILKTILPEMDSNIAELQSIAANLDETWDGAASKEFISRLSGQVSPMKKSREALVGFKDYAENTAEDMERIDRILDEITQRLSDLWSGMLDLFD